MEKQKPTFTLLAFHYFVGTHNQTHPGFGSLIERLKAESVSLDQGVYILRTQQDAQLIDECMDYLQSSHKPYALVRFDPSAELSLQHGYTDLPTKNKIELWYGDLGKAEST